MANLTFIARMSLTGVGCRLQTCSRLASERFNSAFCAPIFTWEQTLKKKNNNKNLHTHINYATCTGNRMCFFYEALYLLFFSIYFLSFPFSFRTTPSIASTFHRLDWSLLNFNQPFPCLKLISCNNINKLSHLIALFFPQIAAEREWLPLEASFHATIVHSDILLIVFEKRNFIAKALG